VKKWFTKKRIIIAAIIVVILIVGFSWFSNHSKSPNYELVTPVRKDLTEVLSVSGQIDADRKAVLKFSVTGKLAYLGVAEGDIVTRGKLLANMDTGDLQSAVTEAYYRYQAADANAKEIEDSVKGHSSDETFAQKNNRVAAQTARDIAYDNWLEAKRALAYAYLYAPFAGIVSNITVKSVGANVGVTDGVTVVDPTSLYFAAEIDETDLEKIAVGQPVVVDLDAFKTDIEGTIVAVGFETRLSDTGATVIPVKVALPTDWMFKLKLGLNGDADIILQTVSNVLALPLEAVKGNEVILENGDKRRVTTGIVTDTEVQIVDGLTENDRVRL